MKILQIKQIAIDFPLNLRKDENTQISNYILQNSLQIQKIPLIDMPQNTKPLPLEVSTQNFRSLFHTAEKVLGSLEKARALILHNIDLNQYYVSSKDSLDTVEQLSFVHLLQENYWISNTLSGQIFDNAKQVLSKTILGPDPLYEAGKEFGLPLSKWKIALMKFINMKQLITFAKLRNESYNNITDMQVLEKKGRYTAIYTYRPGITLTNEGFPIAKSVCDWNRGVFTYFITLLGKKNVEIRETKCVTAGDEKCVFEVTYAPEDIKTLMQKTMLKVVAPGLLKEYETALQQADLTQKQLKALVDKQLLELHQKNIELELKSAELERLNTIDALTNMKNRGYFDKELARLSRLSSRDSSTIALIMIDIDHFKNINDTYGHPFGDLCLKIVAKTLHKIIQRENDFIARYGGEEFVVVLPSTEIAGALTIAEKMRKAIEKTPISLGKNKEDIYITISAGVTIGKDPQELTTMADKALYRAKALGRNRVEKESMVLHQ